VSPGSWTLIALGLIAACLVVWVWCMPKKDDPGDFGV
jgi:hypothetical protein